MNANLSRLETKIVHQIWLIKVAGCIAATMGLLSMLVGLYVMVYRPMTDDTKTLNSSLVLYSIGIFVGGCVLSKVCTIIRKLWPITHE